MRVCHERKCLLKKIDLLIEDHIIIGFNIAHNRKKHVLCSTMQTIEWRRSYTTLWVEVTSTLLIMKIISVEFRFLNAKCGAQEEQPSTSIHYQEKTTIIKTALKPRKGKDAYHLLDRPGQVVLARLRSGHNRLNAHMHRKLKIVPSPNVSLWWGGPDNRACSSEM